MWTSPCVLLFLLLSSKSFGLSRSPDSIQRLIKGRIGATVSLSYGTFHGLEDTHTETIYFRGVRYADAPVGNLRWRAPVSPPLTHLGDVDATQFAKGCITASQSSVTQSTSEDCLFVNIDIPINTTALNRLPVLVYIHGGGFQNGNSHATSDFIMRSSTKPMIFVTFDFRLGALGFLGGNLIRTFGHLNAGLLDQRAALRWVQRYIHHFGGDKNKVTIWGNSAGGGSTMFHLMANKGDNEGLFRAASGDSPSLGFMPAFDESYVLDIFNEYSSLANCGNQGSHALECLRSASADTLAEASSRLLAQHPSTTWVFVPLRDGILFKDRPVEAFKAGRFAKVPVLYGSNTDEGANWSARLRDPSANTSMPNATEDTVFNFIHGQFATAARESINRAFELYPLQLYNGSYSLQGQQMYGEARYVCTALMITGRASRLGIESYQYHYDNPHLGSFHASELSAFFGPSSSADANDLALFQAMREYLTSFATTGAPIAKDFTLWKGVDNVDGNPRLLLKPAGTKMEYIDPDLTRRCNFWHELSQELRQ